MWHISIPERRTHPLFFRYPLYRNSERNRSIQTATPNTAQPCYRPAAAQHSPSGDCLCPTHTTTTILQAILHNHHPTQQKYNFVPFKSQK